MNETPTPETPTQVTEVVGRFDSREEFTAAVEALRKAGFPRDALSVLDTHQSLEAAKGERRAWQDVLSGMTSEVTYIGPLATAGIIAVAAGPVGAMIASLMAAGIGGLALREALEEVEATPDTEAFAKALEAGALLLWVWAEDSDGQAKARAILSANGAEDVHVHTRPYRTEES
ncbi:MAG: hypothetical protein WDZ84_01775 [Rhodovibrionaceae bacterium]